LTGAYLSFARRRIIQELSNFREVSGDKGIGPVVGIITIKGHNVR
jgi:hypothetical protein